VTAELLLNWLGLELRFLLPLLDPKKRTYRVERSSVRPAAELGLYESFAIVKESAKTKDVKSSASRQEFPTTLPARW